MHEVKNKHTNTTLTQRAFRHRLSPPRWTEVWVEVVRPEWTSQDSCSVPRCCSSAETQAGGGEPLSRGHRATEAPGRADALTSRAHAQRVLPFPPRQSVLLSHGLARDASAICGPRLRSSEASEQIRYLAASEPSCGSPGSKGV